MQYKAVLFDLDGTLLDTLDDLADSINAALGRLGFPARPVANYRYYVGDGLENTIHRALPEGRDDDETIARCIAACREEYAARYADKTVPYPGVPDLLDGLAGRRIRMAVLSNKPDRFTRMCVEALLGDWRFGPVLGTRPGVPIKPDPTAALEVARRLGVPPHEFLYLGDTGTDMQTACAAGMHPVGALWGFRAAEELSANGARALISDPRELLDLLG
jgi:phosphoglycolate phosphatase